MNNPMPDVTVIVPTRNEAGNVAVVADRVAAALWGARLGASARLDWELVFVDDSDDETVAVLAGLAAVTPPVSVVHRAVEERVAGLSGAVLAGLAVTTSRWVAVMDADLQHPPELLGDLLDPVVCGRADVAIASRYCAGRRGGATGRWGRVVSGGARSTVRMAFPRVRPVSDPLGGFFAFDRAVVEGVHLRPEGFKILLEVLVRGPLEPGRRGALQRRDAHDWSVQGRVIGAHALRPSRRPPVAGGRRDTAQRRCRPAWGTTRCS